MREDMTTTGIKEQRADILESRIRQIDEATKQGTGVSLIHMLTLGSIGASIALFASGKRDLGIFIGLWAPTFQALKSAAENKQAGNL
jgi:hypothetical protein